jgi:hypothetical protein
MEHARAWAMVETMARMQQAYNLEVHADWRNQGYPFYRAVWVECAELLDHYGWKWWKLQRPDLEQVKLEIVDIWHFGMSDMLRAGTLTPEIAPRLLGPVLHPAPGASHAPDDFRAAIETLALATLQARQFVLEPFVAVLAALPLPFDELFRLYVGKNVLNSFRLAHGYKTGTYAKRWGDREDNEHLVELLEGLVCSPEDVPDVLYAELATRYRALTA